MLANLRRRIAEALGMDVDDIPPDDPIPIPVVKSGIAQISGPEQIQETYCDISSKDMGERYIGLQSGVVYVMAHQWELNE